MSTVTKEQAKELLKKSLENKRAWYLQSTEYLQQLAKNRELSLTK